jgi:hypothetical protein
MRPQRRVAGAAGRPPQGNRRAQPLAGGDHAPAGRAIRDIARPFGRPDRQVTVHQGMGATTGAGRRRPVDIPSHREPTWRYCFRPARTRGHFCGSGDRDPAPTGAASAALPPDQRSPGDAVDPARGGDDRARSDLGCRHYRRRRRTRCSCEREGPQAPGRGHYDRSFPQPAHQPRPARREQAFGCAAGRDNGRRGIGPFLFL